MGDPYCQTRWMQLRMHIKSHSLNLCSRFSAHDRNVTFIARLLHRKVRVCVCMCGGESREGWGRGDNGCICGPTGRSQVFANTPTLHVSRIATCGLCPSWAPSDTACDHPAANQKTCTTRVPPGNRGSTKFAWSSVTTLIKSKLQPYAINSQRVWLWSD